MSGVEVLTEQVRTLYRQTATVLLANIANALIVTALLWETTPHQLLVLWLALMGLMTAGRVALARRYQRSEVTSATARHWAHRFVVGSALSGTLWGGAAFFFLDGAGVISQLLLAFFVGGMCSAAAGTLAAYLPAFVAYGTPALLALAARVALFGDVLHQVLAVVIVLYGAGLYAVARVNHSALTQAFALRYENADLLATLSLTQRCLEEANHTLEQRVLERTEALRKQSEALRDAQRLEAIGRLAGGVAHDFNNLLTIILANVSELADTELTSRTRAALREMREAGTKGADLVRQLLAFSRRQRVVPETVNLNSTLDGMDRLLSRLLGERLVLKLSLQPSPMFVHMDPTQLEQVIINLITNARDAMNGSGTVTVETETVVLNTGKSGLPPGTYACFGVLDTGVGMDSETQRHIFEPFYTTKELGKGTGLGLSTAYGIVEQSGGHIEVTSQPGEGSAFRVYLPLAEPPAETGTAPKTRTVSGMRPITKAPQPVTVLLVEDEPTVRSVTRRILERAGHRVLTSSSAEQALELAAQHPDGIDLLITDVVMAGMGGPTLALRLRSERPNLRTLFISGYSKEHLTMADDHPTVSFLPKPFTHDALLARVTEMSQEHAPGNAAQALGLKRQGTET
jgi:signal transduction histidine kinase/ActR/RegA family two-component response regulator